MGKHESAEERSLNEELFMLKQGKSLEHLPEARLALEELMREVRQCYAGLPRPMKLDYLVVFSGAESAEELLDKSWKKLIAHRESDEGRKEYLYKDEEYQFKNFEKEWKKIAEVFTHLPKWDAPKDLQIELEGLSNNADLPQELREKISNVTLLGDIDLQRGVTLVSSVREALQGQLSINKSVTSPCQVNDAIEDQMIEAAQKVQDAATNLLSFLENPETESPQQ